MELTVWVISCYNAFRVVLSNITVAECQDNAGNGSLVERSVMVGVRVSYRVRARYITVRTSDPSDQ